jgi:hypothetical protein
MTMRNCSTIRPNATDPVDASGTDHGICVSAVDNHGCRESGDGESSEYQQAHSCLLSVSRNFDVVPLTDGISAFGDQMRSPNPSNAQFPAGSANVLQA